MVNCVDFFFKERPECGIYNVVNKNTITTKSITDKMGLQKKWITTEEFKSVVKVERSSCSLNTDKIEKVFSIRTIEEALDKTIYEYRKDSI